MCELRILTFSFLFNMFYLPAVFQLLLMTDVTDMQTVPAAPPTPTGASGVMIRNASQQAATAAWSVFAGGRGTGSSRCAQRGWLHICGVVR